MVNGATASTAAASVLVAANTDRGSVTLLYVSGSPTFLSFGTTVPVVDTGLFLSADVPVITINDQRAREAINGICDTGLTAAGTYVTDVMATIIGGGGDNAASEALLTTIDADTGAILAALGGGAHKLLAADVKTTEVATSETIQSLVGGDLQVGVNKITIRPDATLYMAVGDVASAASVALTSGVWHEIACVVDTDIRFYAAAATNIDILQEG